MLKLIFLAALAGFSTASDVLEYTDDDFESKIGDHELILVEFFAPWYVPTQSNFVKSFFFGARQSRSLALACMFYVGS